MSFVPVIIIGAPRSGTNMLRDAVTALPGAATWPCDEINYVWRHGNVTHPSDEFSADMATPFVKRYIARQFKWVAGKYGADKVVEKTCANSLRVGFVDAVVPEAKYVFIKRNGLDAAASALKRWNASFDLGYTLKKARFVPPTDAPYYLFRYVHNRLYRLTSQADRLKWWGPMLADMHELLSRYTLDQVCALQWKRCVDAAQRALERVEPGRVIELEYEELVNDPVEKLRSVAGFLDLTADQKTVETVSRGITSGRVGAADRDLSREQRDRMIEVVRDTLERNGYA